MTEEEFRKACDGLYAYDDGATDSGIKDELLRQECIQYIKSQPIGEHETVPRLWFSRLVRDMSLSEKALAQGYGIEDAISFIRWMQEKMELPELIWN